MEAISINGADQSALITLFSVGFAVSLSVALFPLLLKYILNCVDTKKVREKIMKDCYINCVYSKNDGGEFEVSEKLVYVIRMFHIANSYSTEDPQINRIFSKDEPFPEPTIDRKKYDDVYELAKQVHSFFCITCWEKQNEWIYEKPTTIINVIVFLALFNFIHLILSIFGPQWFFNALTYVPINYIWLIFSIIFAGGWVLFGLIYVFICWKLLEYGVKGKWKELIENMFKEPNLGVEKWKELTNAGSNRNYVLKYKDNFNKILNRIFSPSSIEDDIKSMTARDYSK